MTSAHSVGQETKVEMLTVKVKKTMMFLRQLLLEEARCRGSFSRQNPILVYLEEMFVHHPSEKEKKIQK